jgi:hypothetical protein
MVKPGHVKSHKVLKIIEIEYPVDFGIIILRALVSPQYHVLPMGRKSEKPLGKLYLFMEIFSLFYEA